MPRRQPTPRDHQGEAPFLAAIRAEPENDLPRLVFADWLEERGDPRGEFVRLQCQLERLPLSAPERYDLEVREQRLCQWHVKEWIEAAGRLAGVRWGLTPDNRRLLNHDLQFQRGLLAGARFSSQESLERFFPRLAADGLAGAMLPRYHTRLASFLTNCRQLSHIERLVLGRTDAVLRTVLESPHCGRLRELQLHGVTALLGAQTMQLAADSPHTRELRSLSIHGSSPDGVLEPLFSPGRLPLLESLECGLRSLGDGVERLAGWAVDSSLTRLHLGETVIRNVRARTNSLLRFLHSPGARRLESLSLALIGWEGVGAAVADNCQHLVDLRLATGSPPTIDEADRFYLSRADLEPLWSNSHLGSLRRLEIECPTLGDELATDLADSHLHELQVLIVHGSAMTSAGLETLLASPTLRKLRTLRLRPTIRAEGRELRRRLFERFPEADFA